MSAEFENKKVTVPPPAEPNDAAHNPTPPESNLESNTTSAELTPAQLAATSTNTKTTRQRQPGAAILGEEETATELQLTAENKDIAQYAALSMPEPEKSNAPTAAPDQELKETLKELSSAVARNQVIGSEESLAVALECQKQIEARMQGATPEQRAEYIGLCKAARAEARSSFEEELKNNPAAKPPWYQPLVGLGEAVVNTAIAVDAYSPIATVKKWTAGVQAGVEAIQEGEGAFAAAKAAVAGGLEKHKELVDTSGESIDEVRKFTNKHLGGSSLGSDKEFAETSDLGLLATSVGTASQVALLPGSLAGATIQTGVGAIDTAYDSTIREQLVKNLGEGHALVSVGDVTLEGAKLGVAAYALVKGQGVSGFKAQASSMLRAGAVSTAMGATTAFANELYQSADPNGASFDLTKATSILKEEGISGTFKAAAALKSEVTNSISFENFDLKRFGMSTLEGTSNSMAFMGGLTIAGKTMATAQVNRAVKNGSNIDDAIKSASAKSRTLSESSDLADAAGSIKDTVEMAENAENFQQALATTIQGGVNLADSRDVIMGGGVGRVSKDNFAQTPTAPPQTPNQDPQTPIRTTEQQPQDATPTQLETLKQTGEFTSTNNKVRYVDSQEKVTERYIQFRTAELRTEGLTNAAAIEQATADAKGVKAFFDPQTAQIVAVVPETRLTQGVEKRKEIIEASRLVHERAHQKSAAESPATGEMTIEKKITSEVAAFKAQAAYLEKNGLEMIFYKSGWKVIPILDENQTVTETKSKPENIITFERKSESSISIEEYVTNTYRNDTSALAAIREGELAPTRSNELIAYLNENSPDLAALQSIGLEFAHTWDMEHRESRSDQWFLGGSDNEAAVRGFNEALEIGGSEIQAHGMSKVGTLSEGIRVLLNMIDQGLDPQRRGGILDTAPLVSNAGEGLVGATTSGSAYRDGPFILLARPGENLEGNLSGLTAILVNEAHSEIVPALQNVISQIRPDLIVAPFSQAAEVVKEIQTQKFVAKTDATDPSRILVANKTNATAQETPTTAEISPIATKPLLDGREIQTLIPKTEINRRTGFIREVNSYLAQLQQANLISTKDQANAAVLVWRIENSARYGLDIAATEVAQLAGERQRLNDGLQAFRQEQDAQRIKTTSPEGESLYRQITKNDIASTLLNRTKQAIADEPNKTSKGLILHSLALSHAENNDHQSALAFIEQIEMPEVQMTSSAIISIAQSDKGNYSQAAEFLQIALSIESQATAYDEVTGLEKARCEIIAALVKQGRSAEAMEMLNKVNQPHLKIGALNQIAIAQAATGDKAEAAQTLRLAFELHLQVSVYENRDKVLRSIADALSEAGFFTEAKKTITFLNKPQSIFTAYNNLVQAQVKSGDISGANETLSLAEKSAKVRLRFEHEIIRGHANLEIAHAYAYTNNFDQALIRAAKISRPDYRARAYGRIAVLQYKRGDSGAARKSIANAIDAFNSIDKGELHWVSSLCNIARDTAEIGETGRALNLLLADPQLAKDQYRILVTAFDLAKAHAVGTSTAPIELETIQATLADYGDSQAYFHHGNNYPEVAANPQFVDTLPRSHKISVLLGAAEKLQKSDPRLSKAYTIEATSLAGKSSNYTERRALANSMTWGDYETVSNLLLNQLTRSDLDAATQLRYLKVLIEIKNPKGMALATKLFADTTLEAQHRRYLANKLISSGYWDKRLGNYLSQSINRIGLKEADKILCGLINQLGLTPDINSYQALEIQKTFVRSIAARFFSHFYRSRPKELTAPGLLTGTTVEDRIAELKSFASRFEGLSREALLKVFAKDPNAAKVYYFLNGGKHQYTLVNNYSFDSFATIIRNINKLEVSENKIQEFHNSLTKAGKTSGEIDLILDQMRRGEPAITPGERVVTFHTNAEFGSAREANLNRLNTDVWADELSSIILVATTQDPANNIAAAKEKLQQNRSLLESNTKAAALLKQLKTSEKHDERSLDRLADALRKELQDNARKRGETAAQISELANMSADQLIPYFIQTKYPNIASQGAFGEWKSHLSEVITALNSSNTTQTKQGQNIDIELSFLDKGKDFIRSVRFADGQQCCFNSAHFTTNNAIDAAGWIAQLNKDPLSFILDIKQAGTNTISGFVFGRMATSPETGKPIIMLNGIYSQFKGETFNNNILQIIEDRFARNIGAESIVIASINGGTLANVPPGYEKVERLPLKAIRAIDEIEVYDDIGTISNGEFLFNGYSKTLDYRAKGESIISTNNKVRYLPDREAVRAEYTAQRIIELTQQQLTQIEAEKRAREEAQNVTAFFNSKEGRTIAPFPQHRITTEGARNKPDYKAARQGRIEAGSVLVHEATHLAQLKEATALSQKLTPKYRKDMEVAAYQAQAEYLWKNGFEMRFDPYSNSAIGWTAKIRADGKRRALHEMPNLTTAIRTFVESRYNFAADSNLFASQEADRLNSPDTPELNETIQPYLTSDRFHPDEIRQQIETIHEITNSWMRDCWDNLEARLDSHSSYGQGPNDPAEVAHIMMRWLCESTGDLDSFDRGELTAGHSMAAEVFLNDIVHGIDRQLKNGNDQEALAAFARTLSQDFFFDTDNITKYLSVEKLEELIDLAKDVSVLQDTFVPLLEQSLAQRIATDIASSIDSTSENQTSTQSSSTLSTDEISRIKSYTADWIALRYNAALNGPAIDRRSFDSPLRDDLAYLVGEEHEWTRGFITPKIRSGTKIFLDELLNFIDAETRTNHDRHRLTAFARKLREEQFSFSPNITENLSFIDSLLISTKANRNLVVQAFFGSSFVGEQVYNFRFAHQSTIDSIGEKVKHLPLSEKLDLIHQLQTIGADAVANGDWSEAAIDRTIQAVVQIANTENSPLLKYMAEIVVERIQAEIENPSLSIIKWSAGPRAMPSSRLNEELVSLQKKESAFLFGAIDIGSRNAEYSRALRMADDAVAIYDHSSMPRGFGIVNFATLQEATPASETRLRAIDRAISGIESYQDKPSVNEARHLLAYLYLNIFQTSEQATEAATNISSALAELPTNLEEHQLEELLAASRQLAQNELDRRIQEIPQDILEVINREGPAALESFYEVFVQTAKQVLEQDLSNRSQLKILFATYEQATKKGDFEARKISSDAFQELLLQQGNENGEILAEAFDQLEEISGQIEDWANDEINRRIQNAHSQEASSEFDLIQLLELHKDKLPQLMQGITSYLQGVRAEESAGRQKLEVKDFVDLANDPTLVPFATEETKELSLLLQHLHRPALRHLIEQDLGISFSNIPLRSQIHFLRYLSSQNTEGFDRLRSVLRRNSENATEILQAFLSNAESPDFTEAMLKIAESEKLSADQKGAILSKYNELSAATNKIETELLTVYGTQGSLEQVSTVTRNLLHRANKFLSDYETRIANSDSQKTTEELVAYLEMIHADVALFGSIFNTLKREAKAGHVLMPALDQLTNVRVETFTSASLSDVDIAQLNAIAEKNWLYGNETNQVTIAKALEMHREHLNDPATTYLLIKLGDDILVARRVTELEDGSVYFGGFNVRYETQESGLGGEMSELMLRQFGDRRIAIDVSLNNEHLESLFQKGFDIEYEVKDEGGKVIYLRLVREADIENAQQQTQAIATAGEDPTASVASIILPERQEAITLAELLFDSLNISLAQGLPDKVSNQNFRNYHLTAQLGACGNLGESSHNVHEFKLKLMEGEPREVQAKVIEVLEGLSDFVQQQWNNCDPEDSLGLGAALSDIASEFLHDFPDLGFLFPSLTIAQILPHEVALPLIARLTRNSAVQNSFGPELIHSFSQNLLGSLDKDMKFLSDIMEGFTDRSLRMKELSEAVRRNPDGLFTLQSSILSMGVESQLDVINLLPALARNISLIQVGRPMTQLDPFIIESLETLSNNAPSAIVGLAAAAKSEKFQTTRLADEELTQKARKSVHEKEAASDDYRRAARGNFEDLTEKRKVSRQQSKSNEPGIDLRDLGLPDAQIKQMELLGYSARMNSNDYYGIYDHSDSLIAVSEANKKGDYQTVDELFSSLTMNPFSADEKDFFSLLLRTINSGEVRDVIEQQLGIKLAQIPLRSQIHFLRFLADRSPEQFIELRDVLFKNQEIGADILKAFLANSEDREYALALLKLCANLTTEKSGPIIRKYNELIDATSDIEHELLSTYGKESKPEYVRSVTRNLIHRANEFLLDYSQRVTGVENESADELIQYLDMIHADVALFASLFETLKAEAKSGDLAMPALDQLIGVSVEKCTSTDLSPEEISQLNTIANKNWLHGSETSQTTINTALEMHDDYLRDPDTTFYLIKHGNDIVAARRVTIFGEEMAYFGGFNVRYEAQKSGLGSALSAMMLEAYADYEIQLDISFNNPYVDNLLAKGFIALAGISDLDGNLTYQRLVRSPSGGISENIDQTNSEDNPTETTTSNSQLSSGASSENGRSLSTIKLQINNISSATESVIRDYANNWFNQLAQKESSSDEFIDKFELAEAFETHFGEILGVQDPWSEHGKFQDSCKVFLDEVTKRLSRFARLNSQAETTALCRQLDNHLYSIDGNLFSVLSIEDKLTFIREASRESSFRKDLAPFLRMELNYNINFEDPEYFLPLQQSLPKQTTAEALDCLFHLSKLARQAAEEDIYVDAFYVLTNLMFSVGLAHPSPLVSYSAKYNFYRINEFFEEVREPSRNYSLSKLLDGIVVDDKYYKEKLQYDSDQLAHLHSQLKLKPGEEVVQLASDALGIIDGDKILRDIVLMEFTNSGDLASRSQRLASALARSIRNSTTTIALDIALSRAVFQSIRDLSPSDSSGQDVAAYLAEAMPVFSKDEWQLFQTKFVSWCELSLERESLEPQFERDFSEMLYRQEREGTGDERTQELTERFIARNKELNELLSEIEPETLPLRRLLSERRALLQEQMVSYLQNVAAQEQDFQPERIDCYDIFKREDLFPVSNGKKFETGMVLQQFNSLELRDHIERDLGISLAQVPLRSQIHFLRFLADQNREEFNRLRTILRANPDISTDILWAFISYAEKTDYSDAMLQIVENLNGEQSGAIIRKYNEITAATYNIESELNRIYGDTVNAKQIRSVASNLIHRANEFLLDYSQRVTGAENDSLTNDLIQYLEMIHADVALFGSIFSTLKREAKAGKAEMPSLDQLAQIYVTKTASAVLQPADIEQLNRIAEKNWMHGTETKQATIDKALEMHRAHLQNPATIYFLIKQGEDIVVARRVTEQEDGSVYFGGFNVRYEAQDSGLGGAMSEMMLQQYGDRRIEIDVSVNNEHLAGLIKKGFVVKEEVLDDSGTVSYKKLVREPVVTRIPQELIDAALKNLQTTSRTAKGVSDTSSSENKPKLAENGARLASASENNFVEALKWAFAQTPTTQTTETVRDLIEGVAQRVSSGLLQTGQDLFRTWETKNQQTAVADLATETKLFYQELAQRLNTNEDPITTAAWVEWTLDGRIHPFADGCGRTTKIIAYWLLNRAGVDLPNYQSRDSYYQEINKPLDQWSRYYRSLFG